MFETKRLFLNGFFKTNESVIKQKTSQKIFNVNLSKC